MCTVYTSRQMVDYQILDSGETQLRFKDNSVAHADILVGADGVHSATRATMYNRLSTSTKDDLTSKFYGHYIEPKWSGTFAYRAIVPAAKLKERYPSHQAISQAKIVSPR